MLFLGGGDPSRLISALTGTPLWTEVIDRWRAGRALAGSSAGAMALCEHRLLPEPRAEVPTVWSRGLGPVNGIALAVHARSRSDRWLDGVSSRAPCPLVALDDGVGILLRPGTPPRGVGSGGMIRLVGRQAPNVRGSKLWEEGESHRRQQHPQPPHGRPRTPCRSDKTGSVRGQ